MLLRAEVAGGTLRLDTYDLEMVLHCFPWSALRGCVEDVQLSFTISNEKIVLSSKFGPIVKLLACPSWMCVEET